ncbi:MAG: ATP-binding protein [Clostridiaceae bacterium]
MSFARNRLEISNDPVMIKTGVSSVIITKIVTAEGCRVIGLAIAMAIAKAYNGEIFVESTVGAGSTFTLMLPNHQRSA